MGETINTQLYILSIFLISGILIGIFFDLFRILRKSFKTPDFITYIEDIIFWLLTGCFLLYLLFTFCNGEIRIYQIIGIIIGGITYFLTLSKYFIRINVKIVTIIKNVILWPLKQILKPISFLVINIRKNMIDFYKKSEKKAKKEGISKEM